MVGIRLTNLEFGPKKHVLENKIIVFFRCGSFAKMLLPVAILALAICSEYKGPSKNPS
jgi:hypothetical protein